MRILTRTFVLLLTGLLATPPLAWAEDAAFHFAVAKMLAGEGSVGAALESFQKAIGEDPKDPYLRIEFAEFLYRIRRLAQAADEAKAAIELAPTDPDTLRIYGQIQLGLAAIDSEAMDRAREAFETLRREEPYDIQSMLALGQIYVRMDAPEKAAEVYTEVVRYHPDNQQLTALLLDALNKAGQQDRAAQVLRDVLRINPGSSRHRLALARILSDQGQHEEALDILLAAPPEAQVDVELRSLLARQLYRRAVGRQPADVEREEDLAKALETIDSVLQERPRFAEGAFLRARILIEQGHRDMALEQLQDLRERLPKDPVVARALAQVLQEAGRSDEALELLGELARALSRSDPRDADEIRIDMMLIHARNGDWDEVAQLSSRLVESVDQELRAPALSLYVEALLQLSQAAEALAVLDRYEDQVVSSTQLKIKRAQALLGLGRDEEAHESLDGLAEGGYDALVQVSQFYLFQQHFERSIPLLRRALAVAETPLGEEATTNLIFMLGQAYERSGEHQDAVESFRKVLDSDPDHAMALNYLGYMWAEQGENLEEALRLIRRAVALDPDNGAYVDSLGWAFYRLGNYQDARVHLERAAELVPGDATILEHLGDLYVALRRYDEARSFYRKAVEVNDEENLDQVRRKLAELPGS